MQWPAVMMRSSPTRVPEQKAPMGCSRNFSPGQRFRASPKPMVASLYSPFSSLTCLEGQRETTESARVRMAGAASK